MSGVSSTESIVRYPGGLSRREVVAWRNATFLVFALPGLAFASWVSRIPAVRDSLGASTEQMGLLIFGMAGGAIVGLLASSHIIARIGSRRTIAWTLSIAAGGLVILGVGATLGSFVLVVAGGALFGAGSGTCDVAMNVSGAANERVMGRSIMPIFHGFFSVGTMVGAAGGALAEYLDVPVSAHLGATAILIVVGVLFAVRFVQSENLVADEAHPVADDDQSKTWQGRIGIWRDPRTILLGLVILGATFAEGTGNDWLALAMVDGHGVSNEVGALVFGVFVTAMTIGRFAGVRLVDRYGRVAVLRGSFLLASVGLLVLIFVPNPWVAAIAAVAWGLGSALGFPLVMSAAADDPTTAAARVSAVATIGYFAFLVGPPVIGIIGERIGLLNALLVALVLVAIGAIVSNAAREPQP